MPGETLPPRSTGAQAHPLVTERRTTEQALFDLDRPQAHLLAVRDVGWRARLFASPWWRRPIPAPIALGAARLVGALRWMMRAEERRQASFWAMRMLNSTRPTRATRRLARRGMMEEAAKVELTWRPWTVARMEIKGIEHLRAARRAGRGVILISAHLGSWVPLLRVLGLREGRVWVIRYRAYRRGPLPGCIGLAKVVRKRWSMRRGSASSVAEVRTRCSRDAFCAAKCASSCSTSGAGRGPSCWGGAIRCPAGPPPGLDVGGPVVPVFPIRRGSLQIGEILPAIWPGDFAGARALHDHLAKLVTRTMRKHAAQAYPPETVLRPWAMTSEDRRRWRAERAARRAGRTAA